LHRGLRSVRRTEATGVVRLIKGRKEWRLT
jgi:hypothetical protein